MKKIAKKYLLAVLEFHAKIAARAYYVGPELEDALRACRRLAGRGLPATIAYWNSLDETPAQVAAAYLSALDAAAAGKLDAYLSMKAPFLGFDAALFSAIVEKAAAAGARLHFDAQEYGETDRVFAFIAAAAARGVPVGCTLPGRWRRSLDDAELAVARGLSVRVVKGQLADPTAPDLDMSAGFLAVVERLAGRARFVAVATHDAALARRALEILTRAKTPCGVELLYGLPPGPARRVAQELGVGVRFYLPYGHGFLPYWFAQGYKRPEVFWWMVRDLCTAPFRGLPDAD